MRSKKTFYFKLPPICSLDLHMAILNDMNDLRDKERSAHILPCRKWGRNMQNTHVFFSRIMSPAAFSHQEVWCWAALGHQNWHHHPDRQRLEKRPTSQWCDSAAMIYFYIIYICVHLKLKAWQINELQYLNIFNWHGFHVLLKIWAAPSSGSIVLCFDFFVDLDADVVGLTYRSWLGTCDIQYNSIFQM